jgi:hypothetical protein
MTPTLIYFIRNERTRAVKIGYASSVRARLSSIRTSSPDPVTLLGAIPGGADVEGRLHDRFKHISIQGEWFRDDRELAAAVELLVSLHDLPSLLETQDFPQEAKRGVVWLRALQQLTDDSDIQLASRCALTEGRVRGARSGRYKYLSHAENLRILGAYLAAIGDEMTRCRQRGELTHALEGRAEALRAAGRSMLRQVDDNPLYGEERRDVEMAIGLLYPPVRDDRSGYGEQNVSAGSKRSRDWLFVQSCDARAG